MSDTADQPLGQDIPVHRFSQKKVDDSWKEEVRRERAAAEKSAPSSESAAKPGAPEVPKSSARTPQPERTDEATGAKKSSSAEQQQSKIFMTFLAGLAQQALMQLGEIESPFSGQRELDLQGARYTIELLTTIQVRTKNNLTSDEETALSDALHDLKIRYVEIAKEAQRQMQAQVQKAAQSGGQRAGPGGRIGRA